MVLGAGPPSAASPAAVTPLGKEHGCDLHKVLRLLSGRWGLNLGARSLARLKACVLLSPQDYDARPRGSAVCSSWWAPVRGQDPTNLNPSLVL